MNESKLYCNVCGENEFTTKEGFYFCNECGTQSQAIRDVVYEGENETGQFYQLKTKIQSKIDKPELTSWECFNYLLRGLVEELIELGAKEELKKVTLQLWTHYLRITEAAFFNKKQVELPKLQARFSIRDARILYNKNITKKKRVKKINESKRVIRRQVRKFMESEYEKLSQSDHTSSLHTSSLHTSTTSRTSSASYATTSRAIRLSFTMSARKYYKKKMNLSHLRKHEIDENSILKCHNLQYAPDLPRKDIFTRLSRLTIYTILYIALNLIQDDIQLSDILRYMHEGHLSSSNIMHFFPDQISKSSEELIKSQIFFSRREIFLDITIRRHTAFLCRLLNIKELKTPNLHNLIKRYINDLNLPNDIEIYINRLINLCPLQKIPLKIESLKSPFYEARAMAFIIFVLKLLFGLDDEKENIISESAKKINEEMELNGITQHKKIFVWNDWVKFIEMRKIILSQCHLPTAIQLNQIMNIEQYLEQFDAKNDDDDNDFDDNIKLITKNKIKIHNIHNIFENFQIKNENSKSKISEYKFSPSMTPNQSYLKEILKIKPENLNIPKFMYNDYSKFDINCFINVKNLVDCFKEKQIQLKINKLSCKLKRNYIGLIKYLFEDRKHRDIMARKIDYEIDEIEWIENLTKIDEKTKIIEKSQNKAKSKPIQLISKTQISTEINEDHNKVGNILDASEKSYEVFSEFNMDPLNENYLREPRRNLDYDDIFADLSDYDDEEIINENNKYEKILEFNISNFDYWIIFGNFIILNETNMKEIKNKFPKSFQWLLETCANQLGIDWEYLFNELVVVENYFANVLESFENVKNFIKFKTDSKPRDLEKIVQDYKNLW